MENNLLKQLTKLDAIQIDQEQQEQQQQELYDNDDDDDNDDYIDFGIGFESLPSLDLMQLDSSTFSSTDIDDDDNKIDNNLYNDKLDINKGTKLLNNAVDLSLLRDELRSNVAYLKRQILKNENEEIFKNIPNIISTLIAAINSQIYDCWTV